MSRVPLLEGFSVHGYNDRLSFLPHNELPHSATAEQTARLPHKLKTDLNKKAP